MKGKFYIDEKVEYEGEYLYNKKWNGKGYDKNGKIIYKLINGDGNARDYKKNKLIFEGEYKNGKRNGKGREYDNDKLIFEGNYKNGKRSGHGIEYSIKYEGEYLNGERINHI